MSETQSTKVCCRCGDEKPLDDFYRWNSPKAKDGHRGDCKECTKTYQNARNKNIPSEQKAAWAASNYDRQLKHRYGIIKDDYDRLLAEQDGRCALCGKEPLGTRNTKKLYVDHNHVTGIVRGLTCRACNAALGVLGDDVAGLTRALEYVKRGEPDS